MVAEIIDRYYRGYVRVLVLGGGRKWVLDPLELYLQIRDSYHGNQTWVLWKSSQHSRKRFFLFCLFVYLLLWRVGGQGFFEALGILKLYRPGWTPA